MSVATYVDWRQGLTTLLYIVVTGLSSLGWYSNIKDIKEIPIIRISILLATCIN